jgi:hypothetical protein
MRATHKLPTPQTRGSNNKTRRAEDTSKQGPRPKQPQTKRNVNLTFAVCWNFYVRFWVLEGQSKEGTEQANIITNSKQNKSRLSCLCEPPLPLL